MAEIPEATLALIDYIDALLTEEAAPATPRLRERPLLILCFTVAGVPLAIPAEEVAEVREGNADGTAEIRHRGRVLPVLDARRLILPADHPGRRGEPRGGGEILVLDRLSLALRCDRVGDRQRVSPDEVVWREQCHSRPWLAGMVRGRALLDVAALQERVGGH